MRRFLTVLFACALGLGAAALFYNIAILMRPCSGEGLACSMTSVIAIIYVPVFSAIALIAFSIAFLWKGTTQALMVALLVPLVPFLTAYGLLKWSEISVREWHEIREHDIRELLLIAIPITLTLVVPWIVLRTYLARKTSGTPQKV